MADKKNNKNNIKKITEFRFNLDIKNLFIVFFVLMFLFYAYRSISSEVKQSFPEKPITTVVKDIKDQKVKKIEIIDNKVLVYYKNDSMALSYKEPSDSFMKTLRDSGINPDNVNIVIKDTQGSNGIINFLSNIIPTVLMVARQKELRTACFPLGSRGPNDFPKICPKLLSLMSPELTKQKKN